MSHDTRTSAAARARWPALYYGWMVVAVAAVAMALTLPGRTHGLGLITKQLLEQTGLSAQQFAWMNFWATLGGAAFCLPCGWLIDRLGVRRVLGGVLLLLGLSTVAMTQAENSAALLAAITLVRGFGQGMLSVISITMVARWFGKNLGPAMGVYAVLMTVAMVAVTLGGGALVTGHGWQYAWRVFGWATVGLALPMALAAGERPRDARGEFDQPVEVDGRRGATLAQALSTHCFWVFALSISFFGMATSGLSLFQQLILEERGFDVATYQRLLGLGLLVGLVSNLTCGALARIVPLARLLVAALATLAASWTVFPWIESLPAVYAYTVVQAAGGGALTVLFFSVWGQAFGRRNLGRIQGAAQMLTVLASAAGPACVAWASASTGSYTAAFWAFAAVALAMAAWALRTQLPQADAWETEPASPQLAAVEA